MQKLFKCLLPLLCLTACATSEDSRYRDTSMLERPPTLVIDKSSASVPYEPDESAIPKKQVPGLGEDVYLTETAPAELKIKKPFDSAWNNLLQAIKLNELNITDQERSKGHIYVGYDASGFFSKVTSFIKDGRKAPVYLLSLKESSSETTITATLANSNEQSRPASNTDGYYENEADASESLLKALYETIHDDLVEE